MVSTWQLAQINVGTIKYPQEDPRMGGFMNRLDEINAIADTSLGFVWRLQGDSGNATDIDVGGEPLFIVNMSVWASAKVLFDFVYKTTHTQVMVQRRDWFERPQNLYQVLWWIPTGHRPSAQEGLERLQWLKDNGPSPHAFTFKTQFPSPDDRTKADEMSPEPFCSGWN
ncbi:MAG: DUF3291 domain-containing protein [Gammaproteobacteria bacterium]|nr:DUF3291 domain-containing protein [Gammaproteobacteria bacterium]